VTNAAARAALVTVALLATGCGAGAGPETDSIASATTDAAKSAGGRYGLEFTPPKGWHARIRRAAVHAANFPLPEDRPGWMRETSVRLQADDVSAVLFEVEAREGPTTDLSLYAPLSGPLRLHPSDFKGSDGLTEDSAASGHGFARRTFSLADRLFVLFVEAGSRPARAPTLASLNELLASLHVERGDFYPGMVAPALFAPRADWHTGSSGPDQVRADGEWVTSWAATVSYADEWNALPPATTLAQLPEEGILIWLGLERNNRFPPQPNGEESFPARQPPFLIRDFERRGAWEGQVEHIPEYVLWGTVGGQYRIDLRVYFGRSEPTERMLARAQAMLDGLELPDWGPWELR